MRDSGQLPDDGVSGQSPESQGFPEISPMSSGTDQACCADLTCQCEQWLSRFCDYETVTHDYCGVETEFASARSVAMPTESIRPEMGVEQADRLWFVSRAEHDVASGVGATITDSDGSVWQVYNSVYVKTYCLWKLWGRNVAKCFALLDPVEIWQVDRCDAECEDGREEKLVARVRASIVSAGGRQQIRNDSDDMVVGYTARLEAWPKKAGEHPQPNHQLRVKGVEYRVLSFEDGGRFVPFTMSLERVQ